MCVCVWFVAGREGERVVGGLSPPVHPHSPRLRSRLSTGGSPVSSFGFDVPSPSGSAGHHGTSGRGCPAFVSCAFSCCTRLGLACGSAGKQGNRGAVRGGAVWRCGLGWGGVGWCVVVWAGVWKAGGGGGGLLEGHYASMSLPYIPPVALTCSGGGGGGGAGGLGSNLAPASPVPDTIAFGVLANKSPLPLPRFDANGDVSFWNPASPRKDGAWKGGCYE